MNYHNPKRKKIRGWKRRTRQVERWGERIKEPYTKYLLSPRGRHIYQRCYLSPFYKSAKRQPPLWFYKRIITQFLTAYEAWEQTFEQLGIPYDLQLWLYDPVYIRSEIICYKMQQQGDLKRFSWESDLNKSFPYDRLSSAEYDLMQFEWILADDEHVHFEEFEDADFTAEDLLADGYVRKEQADGVAYYAKRLGDIWIGRRKGKLSAAAGSVIQGYFAPPI